MENFNKNWLAILLIVVIFSTLGFLTGRVTAHCGQCSHHKKIHHGEASIMEDEGDDEATVTVKIDTVKKDGKNLQIKVEKTLKK